MRFLQAILYTVPFYCFFGADIVRLAALASIHIMSDSLRRWEDKLFGSERFFCDMILFVLSLSICMPPHA